MHACVLDIGLYLAPAVWEWFEWWSNGRGKNIWVVDTTRPVRCLTVQNVGGMLGIS